MGSEQEMREWLSIRNDPSNKTERSLAFKRLIIDQASDEEKARHKEVADEAYRISNDLSDAADAYVTGDAESKIKSIAQELYEAGLLYARLRLEAEVLKRWCR